MSEPAKVRQVHGTTRLTENLLSGAYGGGDGGGHATSESQVDIIENGSKKGSFVGYKNSSTFNLDNSGIPEVSTLAGIFSTGALRMTNDVADYDESSMNYNSYFK